MKDLWQRVAVAAVGMPIALAAVWVGPPALVLLLILVGVVCWRELTAIIGPSRAGAQYYLGMTAVALVVLAFWWHGADDILPWLMVAVAAVIIWRLIRFEQSSFTGVRATVFGSCYVGLGLGAGVGIRVFDGGRWLLLALIVLIWVADTSAFAIGKIFGKTRLAPRISPGKTWEGALGSLVVVVAMALLLPGTGGFRGIFKVFFAALVWLSALVGDLFESSLKRGAGIKDSGSVLPGHGGFLDRLDSLLLAAPAAYSYLLLIGVH